jgi:hypothetical protein
MANVKPNARRKQLGKLVRKGKLKVYAGKFQTPTSNKPSPKVGSFHGCDFFRNNLRSFSLNRPKYIGITGCVIYRHNQSRWQYMLHPGWKFPGEINTPDNQSIFFDSARPDAFSMGHFSSSKATLRNFNCRFFVHMPGR